MTESEIGSRPPKESTLHKFISVVAFCWSLFQVWVASPLQFEFAQLVGSNAVILSDLQIRSVHLSVGIFLVFLLFPARERSPCDRVPINDWIFAIMGSAAVFCVCLFYSQISLRLGLPTNADVMFALISEKFCWLKLVNNAYICYVFKNSFIPVTLSIFVDLCIKLLQKLY